MRRLVCFFAPCVVLGVVVFCAIFLLTELFSLSDGAQMFWSITAGLFALGGSVPLNGALWAADQYDREHGMK